MTTFWQKPAYTAADRDPVTNEILPGALPPGIYCENEAALDKLRRGARIRSRPFTPTLAGHWRLDGQDVYLCTPEQAEFFHVTAAKAPPAAPAPDPMAGIAARMKGLVDRMDADRRAQGQASMPVGPVTRQQRRAAERAGGRA